MQSIEAKTLRVFLTGPLAQTAVDKLSAVAEIIQLENKDQLAVDELLKVRPEVDAIISVLGDRISSEITQSFPKLRVIAVVSIGFDQVDIKYATEKGILVINAPGVLVSATADLAFGLLLACARRICEADKYVRAKLWTGWKSGLMYGTDLNGRTLGIIGMGQIGQCMARRASAFDMQVIYTRFGPADQLDRDLSEQYKFRRVDLDGLLEESDFISVHCPLTSSTRHLLGKTEFRKVKPGCILINTARGPVIDQDALITALRDGQLRAAGLDVFEKEPQVPEELLKLDNVVLTPHIGNATNEARDGMANLAVEGLLAAFQGKRPANLVNPDAWSLFQLSLMNST